MSSDEAMRLLARDASHPVRLDRRPAAAWAPDVQRRAKAAGHGTIRPAASDRANARPRRFTATLVHDVEAIAADWSALQQGGVLTVYQHLDWVRATLAHLVTPAVEPCFVVLRDAATGAVQMIWPLAITRRLRVRTVAWLDLGVTDYAAPVMAPGLTLSPEDAAEAWGSVREALPRADLVRFARIPRLLGTVPNPLAAAPGTRPSALHASGVTLAGDPDTLVKRLASKSTFRDIAKTRNRLESRGPVGLVVADTEASVDALFDALLAHRRARFRKMGRFDLLNRPEVARFYRDAAKAGLASGHVRLFGLAVGDRWIATSYCLVGGTAIHGLLLSMCEDPTWPRCSPGLLLASENMMWARREGLTYFDFTIGDLPYKGALGGSEKEILDLTLPLTAVGLGAEAVLRLGEGSRATLERHPGLMTRLKAVRRAMRRGIGRA